MARLTLTALTVALLVGTAARATSNDEEIQTPVAPVVTETRDENGHTALMVAAAKGDTAAVRTLIEAGAEVNARGRIGNTALIYAAQQGHATIARLLVKAGADIDAANDYGTTARNLAIGYGYREIVERFEQQPKPEEKKALIAGFF